MGNSHPLAASIARLYRQGSVKIDGLLLAAAVAPWAHEALRETEPDLAARIPEPKRGRGRDPAANIIRDAWICGTVNARIEAGASLREACRVTAAAYPEFSNQHGNAWKAVAEIWRKRPNK